MTSIAEKSAVIRMFHVHKRYGAKQALVDATLDIAQERIFIHQRAQWGRENQPC